MAVRQGNITGSVSTIPFDIASKIISARFVNRSVGSITVNVYIATTTGDRKIVPLNLLLISGSIYAIDYPIIMKPGDYLIIVSTGSLDYYISIE